jgi:protein-S-isoprenylcysteine O-methyltransferase Ste14
MVLRLIIQTIVWLAVTAALLFIPASTVRWPCAWIMLGEMGAAALMVGYWLLTHDTRLLKERLSSVIQREQKMWDKVVMGTILLLWSGWFVLMGLDVGRHGMSQIPSWLHILGVLGIPVCAAVSFLTFRENSYAAPVVKIQEARGQTTIMTGPYARVRHPMYAGAIPYFTGIPLLLGSLWGLALGPLIVALLGVRAVLEERALHAELANYEEYAGRVRYRLIPFVW